MNKCFQPEDVFGYRPDPGELWARFAAARVSGNPGSSVSIRPDEAAAYADYMMVEYNKRFGSG